MTPKQQAKAIEKAVRDINICRAAVTMMKGRKTINREYFNDEFPLIVKEIAEKYKADFKTVFNIVNTHTLAFKSKDILFENKGEYDNA